MSLKTSSLVNLYEKLKREYMKRTPKSRNLYDRARPYLPNGVTYNLRYFQPYPLYITTADGPYIWDVDGNKYIDLWMVHGAAIFGHNYRPVIDAIIEYLNSNSGHLGWSNPWESRWAEAVTRWFQQDMARPTNSGTEANMYAIRLARAFTGKPKIGKFIGGWHGSSDELHIGVHGDGTRPESLGLRPQENVLLLRYNDFETITLIRKHASELACVIMEPVMGAGGAIPSERQFIEALREECTVNNVVLIFDEVITGFRFYGGASRFYGVKPDIVTAGKAVTGQYFPGAGAIVGRADIMRMLESEVFHGGTYTGNPISMIGGYTLIGELERRHEEVYSHLNRLGDKLREGLRSLIEREGFEEELNVTGIGSMLGIHSRSDTLLRTMHMFFLTRGISFLNPTTPHLFLSLSHTEEHVKLITDAFEEFLSVLRKGGIL